MPAISLLPEEYKKKEEEDRKKRDKQKTPVADTQAPSFHVPPPPPPPEPSATGPVEQTPNIKKKVPIARPVVPPPSMPPSAPKPAPRLSEPPPTPPKPRVPPPTPPAPSIALPRAVEQPLEKKAAAPASAPRPTPPPPAAKPTPPEVRPPARKVELSTPKEEASHVLRVSLIPGESDGAPTRPQSGSRSFVIATIAALAVLGLVFGGLRFLAMMREREIARIDLAISETNAMIRSTEAALAAPRQTAKKLSAGKRLLEEHILWTRFFDFLEKETLPTVSFSQFRSETNGMVTLEAVAPTFADAAAQMVVFRNAADTIAGVEAGGVSADIAPNGSIRGVRFTLVLRLTPGYLKAAMAQAAP